MKHKILIASVLILNALYAAAQQPAATLHAVVNGTHKNILVAAHRGDWRNAPENSLNALLNCIDKGFDMMELDVKMTKDSVLIVMHDQTIDRTTNAKGKVSDYTFNELSKFRLKNGLGRVTSNPIPTFKEMMLAAKGKILINVDKGNDHLTEVFKVLRETATTDQAIVNVGDNIAYKTLISTEKIPTDATIMVVVNMAGSDAIELIKGYKPFRRSIVQPIFNTDTLASLKTLPVLARDQKIWLNSLWPSLNGGHDDDRAVEGKDTQGSWAWLIDFKPAIIQSDRPADLIQYLKSQQLHK